MKKFISILALVIFIWPVTSQAAILKNTYPRLANYFLKWEINDAEVKELAKWDLLILDMENQVSSRPQILKIRELNPRIIILAYLTSQEILDGLQYYNGTELRRTLNQGLENDWWLHDANGQRVSNWPNTFMLNLTDGARPNAIGERFNDYLPEFVVNKLKSSGLWDGVFYDNTWGDVFWVNKNLDLNNDGRAESAAETDRLWAEGFKKMLARTRSLAGPDFIIVGNGRVYDPYQPLINGMMLENFPSAWENGGTWTGSIKTYLKIPSLNVYPATPIINIYDKNQNNFRHMRYGLASTLLGDGFYSYDYDVTNHGQTWWYDEYDWNLGTAQSAPYNLLTPTNNQLQPGLWRRDFKNGLALINSTNIKQTYVFAKEELEKIKGQQDQLVNNGQKINYIQLAPQDGVILLKRSLILENNPFTNGYFYRYFNTGGQQVRSGFFPYIKSLPGEAEIISADNGDNLSAAQGQLSLYRNGQRVFNVYPFTKSFKNSLSLAAKLSGDSFNQIIVGAGPGGGPQVQIFSPLGKLLGSFFAYDKNLRGGVNVAIADVDGDGRPEIITGPGKGEEPRIKIFNFQGELKNSWLAYDSKLRGGINVAAGDINGDGRAEVITAPAAGGGPQIRIFSGTGRALSSWFAFDATYHGGVKVTVSDVQGDGRVEILVGLKNFY